MKSVTRNNVFETNSSTNHTYTFTLTRAKKKEKEILLTGFKKKAALLKFLFDESYTREGMVCIGGVTFVPEDVNLKDYPIKYKERLLQTLNINKDIKKEELFAVLTQRIARDERDYFLKKRFSYDSFFEIKEGGIVKDTMPENIRTTLFLKISLFILCSMSMEDDLKFLDHLFSNQIQIENIPTLNACLDCQMLSVSKLEDITYSTIELYTSKSIQQLVKEVGYIGFEGLLDSYYSINVLEEELKLSFQSYDSYIKSLVKFLTDDKIKVKAK